MFFFLRVKRRSRLVFEMERVKLCKQLKYFDRSKKFNSGVLGGLYLLIFQVWKPNCFKL